MKKRMLMNGFTQCSPTPQSEGQWKNPRDRSSPGYCDVEFWLEVARTLERGYFDSFFFADIHGVYDVYAGNMDAGIRHAVQVPGNDPTLLFPLLAHHTRYLGFISTYSTTYYQPFLTAKLFSSLDHFTRGRVGWNIVTSYLASAERNGLGAMLSHDERYEQAEEYMEVVYRLWEESWDDDAVVRDTARDVHTDPRRVHKIDHRGRFYAVEGPHMCEPSPQRTPFLVQAGQSPRGVTFAARHAEAQFVVFQDTRKAREGAAQVRAAAITAGRQGDDVKLLQAIGVIAAETEAEARLKHERFAAYASVEGALALFGGWTGVDLSAFKPSDTLDAFASEGMQHLAAFFQSVDGNRKWTFREMCDYMKLASLCPLVVGTPVQIADELERWMDEGDMDGFNLMPIIQPESFVEFVDLVVPELQNRGRMRTRYEGATLRESFNGPGQARLSRRHPGSRRRGEQSHRRAAS
jgi:FMN-dependent oxidoreductase (nitrilotriacetate monooxygenase family)